MSTRDQITLAIMSAFVGVILGGLAVIALAPEPWHHCPEDAVYTWQGEFPAERDQYGCVPLDDIAPEN